MNPITVFCSVIAIIFTSLEIFVEVEFRKSTRQKRERVERYMKRGMPPGYILLCNDSQYLAAREDTRRPLSEYPGSKRTREEAVMRAWDQYETENPTGGAVWKECR